MDSFQVIEARISNPAHRAACRAFMRAFNRCTVQVASRRLIFIRQLEKLYLIRECGKNRWEAA